MNEISIDDGLRRARLFLYSRLNQSLLVTTREEVELDDIVGAEDDACDFFQIILTETTRSESVAGKAA